MKGRVRWSHATVALALIASLAIAASAPLAAAATVTIGQKEPTVETCISNYDWVQPTVTSGNSYVVPATGTTDMIASWSTYANSLGGVMTMKVYRPVTGATYMAVGHDGPRTLTAGVLNTFSGISVPVKPGDVLGVRAVTGSPACIFDATGDAGLYRPGDLADGQSGDFVPDADDRLNITAAVTPLNRFTLDSIRRNKKKGTATLNLTLPNLGDLAASGSGVKAASAGRAAISKAVPAGQAKLLIKAKGKKKRKLNETGKVKLSVAVTYTPAGGEPGNQSLKVKLKKNP